MNSFITLDQVLASHAKYPNAVLSWQPNNFRDLKTINKKAKFDVTWVNLQFKTESGKKIPCKLKITSQILGSGAKAPQTKEKEDVSAFTVQFKSMNREEIEGGDYVPRVRDSPEAQKKEDQRVSSNIDEYTANNVKLIQVLEILNASFVKVANEIIAAEEELKFTVRKDRKTKEIPIVQLKQTTRYDVENKKDVPLDSPIYRVKLPVYKNDGRIGQWNSFKDQFRDVVFDARKMTKKNGFKPVPAYVKKGKEKVPLDVKNVQGYITYKSLVSGTIHFESATISKAGISCGNKFYDMYIIRHKTSGAVESVTSNDITDMRKGLASDDEGSDVEITEVSAEKKNNDSDNLDAATDDENDEAVPENGDTSEGEDIDDGKDDDDETHVESSSVNESSIAVVSLDEDDIQKKPRRKRGELVKKK